MKWRFVILATCALLWAGSIGSNGGFGAGAPGHSHAVTPEGFEENQAFGYLKKITDLGPRPSGSQANYATQQFILGTLHGYGISAEQDRFVAITPRGKISMNNIIAKIPGESPEILIIAGHYDTKLFDSFRFVGANDGGSSAAFVLEMAHALKQRKNLFTMWCVFFDGEEAVGEWSDNDSVYGSRHMVEELRRQHLIEKVRAMILVDMIGDRDLDILKEGNSTPWLNDIIWNSAAELGYQKEFVPRSFDIGGDDHFPFLRAGIPAVDLIDFDYGFSNAYWHSGQDTLDKCSARSLGVVGNTLLRALPRIEARLKRNPGH
ncbi:MAG: M28 family peptidase [Acidobacteriia bacterium]|nr:M28 family peptidase [Terriglobia bacterium]